MGKRARYILYALVLALPWASQIMFPNESIWEPVWWTISVFGVILVIETWGKP